MEPIIAPCYVLWSGLVQPEYGGGVGAAALTRHVDSSYLLLVFLSGNGLAHRQAAAGERENSVAFKPNQPNQHQSCGQPLYPLPHRTRPDLTQRPDASLLLVVGAVPLRVDSLLDGAGLGLSISSPRRPNARPHAKEKRTQNHTQNEPLRPVSLSLSLSANPVSPPPPQRSGL